RLIGFWLTNRFRLGRMSATGAGSRGQCGPIAVRAAGRAVVRILDSVRDTRMHKSSHPLTAEERQEIADWVAFGLHRLGVEANTESADELQDLLRCAIDQFRRWDAAKRAASLDRTSLCLGCLWGQTVCDRLGWEWAKVSLGPEWEGYGVVSPSRSHVVLP